MKQDTNKKELNNDLLLEKALIIKKQGTESILNDYIENIEFLENKGIPRATIYEILKQEGIKMPVKNNFYIWCKKNLGAKNKTRKSTPQKKEVEIKSEVTKKQEIKKENKSSTSAVQSLSRDFNLLDDIEVG